MKLLALDTSTERCSAALWLDGEILARRVQAGQMHSSLLLPMVDGLLACAVTQGLALGADLPVHGVSTLESIAQQTDADRVLTLLDARMAEVYWAAYERAGAGWNCVLPPVLSMPESVFVPERGDWVGAGNGFAVMGAEWLPRLESRLARMEADLLPDAAAIAELAAHAFARGEGLDAALAAPVYLRDKVALTVDERLPGKRQA
jgi:tRNA threonylcarbamoyladenosine biosynthesis protein TsaB